jgi:hypothetical protein
VGFAGRQLGFGGLSGGEEEVNYSRQREKDKMVEGGVTNK